MTTLMMGAEVVSETLVTFNQLTQLTNREYFTDTATLFTTFGLLLQSSTQHWRDRSAHRLFLVIYTTGQRALLAQLRKTSPSLTEQRKGDCPSATRNTRKVKRLKLSDKMFPRTSVSSLKNGEVYFNVKTLYG